MMRLFAAGYGLWHSAAEVPTKLELVLGLETAKTLDLDAPPTVRARAD